MKKFCCLIVLLVFCGSCINTYRVSPQKLFYDFPAATGDISPTDIEKYREKYPGHSGVYLLFKRTVEHYGDKEIDKGRQRTIWRCEYVIRAKLLVLDPDDTLVTTTRFSQAFDTCLALVSTPDGVVRSYGLKDFTEMENDDGDTYWEIQYPDIVSGTVIEEILTWSIENDTEGKPVGLSIPLQLGFPCERMEFTFACPDWWEIVVKKVGHDRLAPLDWNRGIMDVDHKQMFEYVDTSVPALTREACAPVYSKARPDLEFKITDFKEHGWHYEDANSRDGLKRQLKLWWPKPKKKYSKEIHSRALALSQAYTSEIDKAKAIVSFVRDSIEQTDELNDWNLSKVLKKRKGMAWDKRALTIALLQEIGIKSRYIGLHPAENGYFDPEYIGTDQFGEYAIHVMTSQGDMVVFPDDKSLPASLIPPQFQERMALTLMDDSVHIYQLPPCEQPPSLDTTSWAVSIDERGRVAAVDHRVIAGFRAYLLRSSMRKHEGDVLTDSLKEMLSILGDDITIDSFRVENLERIDEPLVIDLYYTIDSLVAVAPGEVVVRTDKLLAPIPGVELDTDPAKRVNPIHIYFDESWTKKVEISYPKHWLLQTATENVTHENDFGSIAAVYVAEPGKLTVDQQVHLNATLQPKTRYGELLDLLGPNTPLSHPTLVFSIPIEDEN